MLHCSLNKKKKIETNLAYSDRQRDRVLISRSFSFQVLPPAAPILQLSNRKPKAGS